MEKKIKFSRKSQGNSLISIQFSGNSLVKVISLVGYQNLFFVFRVFSIYRQLSKLQLNLLCRMTSNDHSCALKNFKKSHIVAVVPVSLTRLVLFRMDQATLVF